MEKEIEAKPFYYSKTFWVNLVAIIVLLIQANTSFIIEPEVQILIIVIVSLILRSVTKQPISWSLK